MIPLALCAALAQLPSAAAIIEDPSLPLKSKMARLQEKLSELEAELARDVKEVESQIQQVEALRKKARLDKDEWTVEQCDRLVAHLHTWKKQLQSMLAPRASRPIWDVVGTDLATRLRFGRR